MKKYPCKLTPPVQKFWRESKGSQNGGSNGFIRRPSALRVSIAEALTSLRSQKMPTARDQVAQFLMRSKKYGVAGLAKRVRDPALSLEQRLHSARTLSIVTGRKFPQLGG